ncbi:MAG: hypothetical protein EOP04_26570, partial [Proteobacteria bacterium]
MKMKLLSGRLTSPSKGVNSICYLMALMPFLILILSCNGRNPEVPSNSEKRTGSSSLSDPAHSGIKKHKVVSLKAPPVMKLANRDDAIEYWQKTLERNPGLSDSMDDKIQHIRGLLLDDDSIYRWSNFDLMMELVDDRTQVLPLVSELSAINPDDAKIAFESILKDTEGYQVVADFIAKTPNDR